VHWLVDRHRQQTAALTEANRKLTQYAATTEQLAASQERNRLARELHDTLAHSLSAVTVQLEAVQSLWELNAAEARRILDRALRATRSGLTEARRALQALRASPLEDLGLALAVSDLAKSVAARANLKLDLEVGDHLVNLPLEVEQCIYRAAQEALTNVARHADARSLQVLLKRENGQLTLTVADDGRGFNSVAVERAHYGLKGLRERAEIFGGRLEVGSQLKHGTTVKLVLPAVEVEI
jgi:signal transduction histidine kinase